MGGKWGVCSALLRDRGLPEKRSAVLYNVYVKRWDLWAEILYPSPLRSHSPLSTLRLKVTFLFESSTKREKKRQSSNQRRRAPFFLIDTTTKHHYDLPCYAYKQLQKILTHWARAVVQRILYITTCHIPLYIILSFFFAASRFILPPPPSPPLQHHHWHARTTTLSFSSYLAALPSPPVCQLIFWIDYGISALPIEKTNHGVCERACVCAFSLQHTRILQLFPEVVEDVRLYIIIYS